jgi:hypothetical protein
MPIENLNALLMPIALKQIRMEVEMEVEMEVGI